MRMDNQSKHNLVRLKSERWSNLHGPNESIISQEIHAQLYSFLPLWIEQIKSDDSRCRLKRKNNFVTRVGFEPTPMKTTALTLRLRPLGHRVRWYCVGVYLVIMKLNVYFHNCVASRQTHRPPNSWILNSKWKDVVDYEITHTYLASTSHYLIEYKFTPS